MNGIAKVAGCRPPWNAKSSSEIEVCSTFSDISKYEYHEYQMRRFYEQELILQRTGCMKPCNIILDYLEFLTNLVIKSSEIR